MKAQQKKQPFPLHKQAAVHIDKFGRKPESEWTNNEKRIWNAYVYLSGEKATVDCDGEPIIGSMRALYRAAYRYLDIAQDLRRQCLEQLARRQQQLQQGELFQ